MADIFDLFAKIAPKPQGPITHLIVGLGNPGATYEGTRHNAGFVAVDRMAEQARVRIDRAKFDALVAEGMLGEARVLFMKPQTFMNLSGEAVSEAAKFYKIPSENILVFSDDVSLDVGRVRMRTKGSDGGQKGLRSITTLMATQDFPRIKFGVGNKPHPDFDMADWVLSEFTKDEQKTLFSCFEKAYDGVLRYLSGDSDGAVQVCNSK